MVWKINKTTDCFFSCIPAFISDYCPDCDPWPADLFSARCFQRRHQHDFVHVLGRSLGIATFLQSKKVIGPFGAGLLIVQGTSFNFIGPIIGIGSAMVAAGTPVEAVMASIFGVVIAGAFIEMGVSQILPWIKKLITPLVTGIVVLLIGLTLIKEGLISMGGGYQAMSDKTFANADNLIMSCTVLALIIILNRIRITWVKSSAILIALICGYVLAGFMGHLDFSGLKRCTTGTDSNPNAFRFKLLLEPVYSDGIHLSGDLFRSDW